MSSTVRTCPRCGIRRQVHESRTGELCRDCKKVDPTWPVHSALESVESVDRTITPRERAQRLLYLRRCIDAELAFLDRRMNHEGPKRVPDPLCGTESGYTRHRRRGETTCDDCRRAHARGEQQRAMRRALKRQPVESVLGAVGRRPHPRSVTVQREAS